MPIDWFDSKYLKPLMAGKNIVRVGKDPAQYLTVADALAAIVADRGPGTGRYLIIIGPGAYSEIVSTTVTGNDVPNISIQLLPGAVFSATSAGSIFLLGNGCEL